MSTLIFWVSLHRLCSPEDQKANVDSKYKIWEKFYTSQDFLNNWLRHVGAFLLRWWPIVSHNLAGIEGLVRVEAPEKPHIHSVVAGVKQIDYK